MPLMIKRTELGERRLMTVTQDEIDAAEKAGTLVLHGCNIYENKAEAPAAPRPTKKVEEPEEEDSPQEYETRDMAPAKKRGRPKKTSKTSSPAE